MSSWMPCVTSTRCALPRRCGRVGVCRAVTGFTLIEILIVVVILGILASIVMSQVASAFGDAERTAFVTDLNAYLKGAETFYLDTDRYPPAADAGEVPAGFENYVDMGRWKRQTPIGGHWDIEFNNYGVTSAIGVHFTNSAAIPDDAFLELIDRTIDNGNLATGVFRRLDADRFYYIILE